MLQNNPNAKMGITVHGAHSPAEAEEAYQYLARHAEEHLGYSLKRYGLLVGDLRLLGGELWRGIAPNLLAHVTGD